MLLNQGYSHIGIIDAQKNIWGYAKDKLFHFCKEDLVEVDRKEIGIDEEILAITEVYDRTDNRLILLKDNQWCANYFIIDGSNMILADCYSHDETSKNQMHRINSNSIVVGEKYCGLGRWKTHQEIIINGKEETDYVLYKTINCLFIFIKVIDDEYPVEGPELKIYSNYECIHEEMEPYEWKHENGDVHLFFTKRIDEKREALDIICTSSSEYYKKTIEISGNLDLYRTKLFTDNYLVIPYENRGVLIVNYGEQYYNITTYTIDFDKDGFAPCYLSDNILTRELGYVVMGESYVNGVEFYDIYGNSLNLLKDPSKSNDRYYVFSIPNKSLFHNIKKLYGVLEISYKTCERVILPPIFEHIDDLGYGLFKVVLGNYLGTQHHKIEYLYSVVNGVIEGYNHNCIMGIDGASIPQVSDKIITFSYDRKIGLIYKGRRIIDASLDDIRGFNFPNIIKGVDKDSILDGVGSCVALYKNKKYGLFIDDRNIINPIYDSIKCILITKEHSHIYAYFEVRKDNYAGVISNNLIFNHSSEIIYDNIEIVGYCSWGALIKVYKDGKVGMISSLHSKEEDLTAIPIIYNDLIIMPMERYIYYVYCADGDYYTKNGDKILNTNNYSYEGCDENCACLIFRNKENTEYFFYNFSGAELDVKSVDGNNNIILVDNQYQFDVLERKFIQEEEKEESKDDWRTYWEAEERRFYENEGYRDAYDGDPDAEWNTD